MARDVTTHVLAVPRGPYRMHAEVTGRDGDGSGGDGSGDGAPVVLMHGFPDNLHLYDRLLAHLAGRRPVAQELHLLRDAGPYVQVDSPERVASLILGELRHTTNNGYTS